MGRTGQGQNCIEDLKTPIDGVVTTYNKPFSKGDHDAITANIPVFGEVKGQRVVYAYPGEPERRRPRFA